VIPFDRPQLEIYALAGHVGNIVFCLLKQKLTIQAILQSFVANEGESG